MDIDTTTDHRSRHQPAVLTAQREREKKVGELQETTSISYWKMQYNLPNTSFNTQSTNWILWHCVQEIKVDYFLYNFTSSMRSQKQNKTCMHFWFLSPLVLYGFPFPVLSIHFLLLNQFSNNCKTTKGKKTCKFCTYNIFPSPQEDARSPITHVWTRERVFKRKIRKKELNCKRLW